MLIQIINEIKISWKINLFGVVICAAIMCVVMIFNNLAEYLMPQIYNEYDEQFEEGIEVRIYGMKLDQVDYINSLHIKNLDIIVSRSTQFDNADIVNNNGSKIDEKELVWLTDEKYDEYKIPKIISADEFNYSDGAIVYCNSIQAEEYEVGSELSLYLDNGKIIGKYIVLKVIENNDMEHSKVVLPAKSVIQSMDKVGYIISYNVTCLYPNTRGYVGFKEQLKEKNIRCTSEVDEVVEIYATLQKVFEIIAVLFTIIAVLVLVVLTIIIINVREKFLIMQKVLGKSNAGIMMIYVVIIELQIIASAVLGCLVGYLYINYLSNILQELYNFRIDVNFVRTCNLFLIDILISNLALIPNLFFIKKTICNKDIVTTVNIKE